MAEWKPIKRGDAVPEGAVLAGKTKSDGDVYVAKNSKGEVGKLNLDKGKVWNIWCHDGGSSQDGEILVTNDTPVSWVKAKKGSAMPAGAFLAGHTSSDGDVFACRNSDGAVGKLNVNGSNVHNFWYHGSSTASSEGEVLCMSPCRWRPIRRGDDIPVGAVMAGRTSSDGDVYVAKNKDGEVGKLNLDNLKMNSIWTHDGGSTQEGEILVVSWGAPISWVKTKKGGDLPSGALMAGNTKSDGDVYPCRNKDGAVGKLNVSGGKANNFWYHGEWFSKNEGEVLCVGPLSAATAATAAAKGKGKGDGGYVPQAKPAPAPKPAPKADTSHFNSGAMCDGTTAGERVKWLMDNKKLSEADAQQVVMSEFPDVFSDSWLPDAMCDGIRAQERAQWLVDNQGMDMHSAREKIKSDFPNVFGDWWKPDAMCDGSPAKDRAKWLVDNKGLSMEAAKQQVRQEFPGVFGGGGDGPLIDCKFPHTMSIVQTPEGRKLKIAVTPRNPHEVSMVAMHYVINDGASMNFDVNSPSPGTNSYVHTTPPGGGHPVCPPGAKVSYWLVANVHGLLQEEPAGACAHADRRLYWTAP